MELLPPTHRVAAEVWQHEGLMVLFLKLVEGIQRGGSAFVFRKL